MNTLNKINVTWVLVLLILGVLAFWYLPDVIRAAETASADWLARFWWFPVMICVLVFLIVALWLYLQFRLKLRGMQMDMEIEKLKYLPEAGARTVLELEGAAAGSEAGKDPLGEVGKEL